MEDPFNMRLTSHPSLTINLSLGNIQNTCEYMFSTKTLILPLYITRNQFFPEIGKISTYFFSYMFYTLIFNIFLVIFFVHSFILFIRRQKKFG